jgi:hypothetical protein
MKSRVSESTLLDLTILEVRSGFSRFKSKAVEKVNVGFGAIWLVVRVSLDADPSQATVESELALNLIDSFHVGIFL